MGGVKERHQGTRCTSIRMSSLSHSLSVIRAKYAQNVLISACAGAAVCAGAYIMWGPDNLFRTRGRCPGLVNLGNSCYVNCILQSLAALPEVRDWFEENAMSEGGHLALAVSDLLSELAQEGEQACSASRVLLALRSHQWRIDSQQQDAHEFYLVLMSTMDEEMVVCPSLVDVVKEENAKCKQVWSRAGPVPVPFRKKLSSPLRGMLSSELYCMQCNYTMPLKYEFFECISLTLPSYKCALETSLLEFVKCEMVNDVTCPQCSKRAGKTVKQTHLKRLHVGRAPSALCVHLNRTVWLGDGSVAKNDQHMEFPVQLNASGLLKRTNGTSTIGGSTTYILHAVVEHRGGPNSGHYITYRRIGMAGTAGGGRWVYTSDTAVYTATLSEVLRAHAYMLFYCRNKMDLK